MAAMLTITHLNKQPDHNGRVEGRRGGGGQISFLASLKPTCLPRRHLGNPAVTGAKHVLRYSKIYKFSSRGSCRNQ